MLTNVQFVRSPKSCAVARNSAKKRTSGGPSRRAVLAGRAKGDRDAVEEAWVLVDDHVRRPAPHRVGVDPRDDPRDHDHQAERGLQEDEKGEAEHRDREQLRHVEEAVEAGEPKEHGQHDKRDTDQDETSRPCERKEEPHDREGDGEEHERIEGDVPGLRGIREDAGAGAVGDECREQNGEREGSPRPSRVAAPPTRGRVP